MQFLDPSQQREETQSFAQKLQLKVPSMESLIRGGASRAENLFRSPSKESLVRSSSRDSLTPLGENDSPGAPMYDPPSDIESEAEEPPGSVESLSKEQLLHRLLRVERSLGTYRGKYSEVRVTQTGFSVFSLSLFFPLLLTSTSQPCSWLLHTEQYNEIKKKRR